VGVFFSAHQEILMRALNKIILVLILVLSLGITINKAYAGYCMVTGEGESGSNNATLRGIIEGSYNVLGEDANCVPPSVEGNNNDDGDYFEQVVVFATREWGWENDVNTIVFTSPLKFKNTKDGVVIGNWAPDVVDSDVAGYYSDFNYDEGSDYYNSIINGRDYGKVVLDFSQIASGTMPLQCENSGAVVAAFRHVTIITNGIFDHDLFNAGNTLTACLRRYGDVDVDAGRQEDSDDDGSPDDEDCNDNDATIYPGATEICDDKDNDCDGQIDEAEDLDTDGDGNVCEDDCNEGDANQNNTEVCDDGYDNDCNGMTDEYDDACQDDPNTDNDGDGSLSGDDCDDNDATVYPGATEVCDGKDNDCNDVIDDLDADGDGYYSDCEEETAEAGDCDDSNASINPAATEVCDGVDNDCNDIVDDVDADGDGYYGCTTSETPDCNDNDSGLTTASSEVCDGIDNDCNGTADDMGTVYADADGDGYGDPSVSADACSAPDGYVDNSGDCDDGVASTNPGASELCENGVDDNCDGLVDGDDTITCAGSATPPDEIESTNFLEGGAGGCQLGSNTHQANPIIVLLVLMALMVPALIRRNTVK